MALTIDTLTDIRDCSPLKGEWNSLVRESRTSSPFLTWEWLHTWWTHFGGSMRLSITIVREDGELIAIAPLRVARNRWSLFPRLEFLGTGFVGADYLDVIVRPGREDDAVRAIAESAGSKRLPFHLDHLTPDCAASRLVRPLEESGWSSRRTVSGVCPFFRLSGHTFDSYLATLGSPHRANVRRRQRNLWRQFDVEFAMVSGDSERRAVLQTLITLHNQRWEKRGGSTAFFSRALRSFHEEFTSQALEAGWLRMFVLRLDGKAAAAIYCLSYHGRYYFYQGAFDEELSPHSIGLVMMGLAIQRAIEEGATEFDMLYGNEPYKSLWANDERVLQRIDLCPPHLRGRVHQSKLDAERTARAIVRTVLRRKGPCHARVAGAIS